MQNTQKIHYSTSMQHYQKTIDCNIFVLRKVPTMNSCRSLLLLITIVFTFSCAAKDFDQDFYKKHLETNSYSIDPDASAVILYENTFTLVEDEKGVLKQTTYVRKIIKILKDDATSLGDLHLTTTSEDDKNYVQEIKATTYNLKDGKIAEDKLTKQDLLNKGIIKNLYEVSFSMPSVRVGSVIDYTYQIVNNHGKTMYTWLIQEKYPKLESDFGIVFPEGYSFSANQHTATEAKIFYKKESMEKSDENFCMYKSSGSGDGSAFWIRRNIAAISHENFVYNAENNIERLHLRLNSRTVGYNYYTFTTQYIDSWEHLNKSMWQGMFKQIIEGQNQFFKPALDSLVKPGMTKYDISNVVYKYVRDNFNVANSEKRSLSQPQLSRIFEARKGDEWEINLLLTAMLAKAGVDAHPIVITSTEHESAEPDFLIYFNIDYLACAVNIDSSYMLLDATDRNNTAGILPNHCYNGYSWIVAEKGTGVYLTPQVIGEKTINVVKISDVTDTSATMEIVRKFGKFGSMNMRKKWAKEKEEQSDRTDEFKQMLPDNITLIDTRTDNENNPDTPLIVHYKCRLNINAKSKTFFIKSTMTPFFDENPLKGSKRVQPVEFPYQEQMDYHFTMVLPENINPDTVSSPMELDYEQGAMHYLRSDAYYPAAHTYTLNASLDINNTVYSKNYFETLRGFFQQVIDDNNRMLIFKKQ